MSGLWISKSGISGTYILPRNLAPKNPTQLAGATIWITAGSKSECLVGILKVYRVEVFEDGLNSGDYCLTIDPTESLKTTNSQASLRFRCKLPATQSQFEEIDFPAVKQLIQVVLGGVKTTLVPPPLDLLAKLPEPRAYISATDWIASATSVYSLDEIWSGRGPLQGFPFAYFILHRLGNGKIDIQLLKAADPIGFLSGRLLQRSEASDLASNTQKVDTKLVPIDSESIYARKFVASLEQCSPSMEKTEAAEKRHQDILRDIVNHLQMHGHNPLQSGSIDLCIEQSEAIVIFEIKSTSCDNLIAQSAAGIFQLGRYRLALENSGHTNIRMVLILEKCEEEEESLKIVDIFSRFGGETFIYDAEQPWPRRVHFGDCNLLYTLKPTPRTNLL